MTDLHSDKKCAQCSVDRLRLLIHQKEFQCEVIKFNQFECTFLSSSIITSIHLLIKFRIFRSKTKQINHDVTVLFETFFQEFHWKIT